jgi:hypothetical protein
MESADAVKTMQTYKTKICPDWLLSKCPLSADACFDAHSRVLFRRKPVLVYHRFNYIPQRCRYSIDECPNSQNCRFAHNRLEVCFHPSVYKTKLCTRCTDHRCSLAHSVEELRMPIYENTRTFPVCDLNVLQDASPDLHVHYMQNYKTKPCVGECKCDGFDYHSASEKRRSVRHLGYLPHLCPTACSSDTCPFAHSRMEVMYHPTNYKTKACSRFAKTRTCLFGADCAHAHGARDLRMAV